MSELEQQMLLCTNCGKDPQEDDANWCISCLMYVEPPLSNDELIRVRVFINEPRRSALKMLIFGRRYANRIIREGNGEEDWWTLLRLHAWYLTHRGDS